MERDFYIKYIRDDGSVGAYSGNDKEAFLIEIDICLKNDWNFEAKSDVLYTR